MLAATPPEYLASRDALTRADDYRVIAGETVPDRVGGVGGAGQVASNGDGQGMERGT